MWFFLYLEKVSFTEPHVSSRNEESLQTVQLSCATLQCAGFHVEVLISKDCKYLLVYVKANMYSFISKNTCRTLIKKYFQLKPESHPNTLIKAEESLVDRQLGWEVK